MHLEKTNLHCRDSESMRATAGASQPLTVKGMQLILREVTEMLQSGEDRRFPFSLMEF